jgi:ABC-type lipoprotein release transport system permease subunit
MKRYWFLRFFKRSLAMRKGKVLIASVSVMFAVMTVTSMLGITAGIREKLGSELRAYGANIMVSSSEGEGLDYSLVDRISGLRQVMDVSGQVFSRAVIGNRSVEIIGLNTGALKEKAWRVDGRRPDKKGEVMAGVNLKMALDLSVGRGISVQAEGGPGDYVIVGFHETGGAEDNSFVMSIQDAWDLTGLPERLDAILVNGESGALDNIVEDIKRTVPGASVKTIRQVALADEHNGG